MIDWLASLLVQARDTDQFVVLEVSSAYGLPNTALVEVLHEFVQTRLWFLGFHGSSLDGADLLMCFLLLVFGQARYVIENIGRLFYA